MLVYIPHKIQQRSPACVMHRALLPFLTNTSNSLSTLFNLFLLNKVPYNLHVERTGIRCAGRSHQTCNKCRLLFRIALSPFISYSSLIHRLFVGCLIFRKYTRQTERSMSQCIERLNFVCGQTLQLPLMEITTRAWPVRASIIRRIKIDSVRRRAMKQWSKTRLDGRASQWVSRKFNFHGFA